MPRPALGLVLVALLPTALAAAPPDFDREVAPVLAARCLDCHSGPKAKGKLDLSRKAGALAGDAPAVVPGKPDESELWKRVDAGEMPPKKPLPDAERKLLRDWIAAGAKWGTDPVDPFRFTSASRAGYDWWALRPLVRPAVPGTTPNPIDAFVQAKLRDKGLSPSPPADKRTLLRRVYHDLTGLSPTPEEVAAFLADDAPDAYERRVDALLASPHYGERWARHWLDVVRFGETDGFERNAARPHAWPYRDWVIRALNADMPFDEFARLQLAGDVLRPNDPDAVVATGFLTAGVHNTVVGSAEMAAIARQDELEDLAGSVGQTFLGLTANCARCHDHKFDPIGQADYYRLVAALAGTGHGERTLPDPKAAAEVARLAARLAEADGALAAVEGPARRAVLAARGGKESPAPAAFAAWDFRAGGDDAIGPLHAEPVGGAKLTPDGAVVDGKSAFVRTAPLPADLRAKTLEAWVRLDTLTQRGGGVISVQSPGGETFDAIVFGEQEPGRWMAGSGGFARTKPFGGPAETAAPDRAVHVAVSYAEDGTITGYRDGKPYGKGYASDGPVTFRAGAVVLFGLRHDPAGGNRMLAGTIVAARLYDRALSAAEVGASFAAGPGVVAEADLIARLTPEQRDRRAELRASRAKLVAELDRAKAAANRPVYANRPQPPGVTRVLARGDLATPGEVVAPGGLRAVAGVDPDFGLPPNATDGVRRRKLAAWVTHRDNPLFARVIANRVWHYHFGTGIVDTPNDLGFNGGRPSHPELLDWLASELREPTAPRSHAPRGNAERTLRAPDPDDAERRGNRSHAPRGNEGEKQGAHAPRSPAPFSLKHLHRLIVTSAAYRQASRPRADGLAADAESRLLWRHRPHRLEGEAVRDAMLAAAGLLNREVGGKGFTDYRERNFNGTAYFDPVDPTGPAFHRRSVYRFVPRSGNPGLLDAFDCPDPAAAAPRRAATTTPLQALALWNGGFALRMAGALADRVTKEAPGDVPAQVRRAWQIVYQRDPTPEEAKLAAKLVADHGLAALGRALFNSNEFLTLD